MSMKDKRGRSSERVTRHSYIELQSTRGRCWPVKPGEGGQRIGLIASCWQILCAGRLSISA
jgi:hypothetical protein